jgi:hypothetical protein
MFEIVQIAAGRAVRHNLHALPLPNGVLAHTLDGGDLYRVLVKLKVNGIRVNMGKQDLLLGYSKFLLATTPDPITGKLPTAERAAP